MLLETQITQICYIAIESRIVCVCACANKHSEENNGMTVLCLCIKNAAHLPGLILHNANSGLGVYGISVSSQILKVISKHLSFSLDPFLTGHTGSCGYFLFPSTPIIVSSHDDKRTAVLKITTSAHVIYSLTHAALHLD